MTTVLSADQMRRIERAAIGSGAVSGLELMERAGQGVVQAILATWPELAETAEPRSAAILCGPGNNGGDGFVVARLLAGQGWRVAVYLYGDPARMSPDAHANFERWCALGAVGGMDPTQVAEGALAQHDVVIDALFGTGLARPVPAEVAAFLAAGLPLGGHARMVAVDIPSGIETDSGALLWPAGFPYPLAAALTVTFHREKCGHFLAEGGAASGKVVVADIGLIEDPAAPVRRITRSDLPDLEKGPGHKYSHGHALVLSGGPGATGAARMAAWAALRIGAGLVTLGVPPAAQAEAAAHLTAVMLRPIADAAALDLALQDDRIGALCLGPGLGIVRARVLVPTALGDGASARRPVVLDADALTAFATAPDTLFGPLHQDCVLTPHVGEFARLFPELAAAMAARPGAPPELSKIEAVRAAAARCGAVVLLKGPDTVIAHPDGTVLLHAAQGARSAPWLATAGAGDVLAGFVTGLLARGLPPMQAAASAAWLHVECARRFGPGLTAEDLPETLPRVLSGLAEERVSARRGGPRA